jgi:hypothetical protein
MKQSRNPILIILALIGVCAVIYGAWHLFAREASRERARAEFSAPASSGVPDVIHASPGPPPPQP